MNEQEKYDWMVYVSCMTFNHASYIEDAMNGFAMQETNFPFVCAIVDDASTDGEQEVIKNYLNDHFDLEDKTIVRHKETDDNVLIFARHKTNLNCFFAVILLKYNHFSIKKSKVPYVSQWRDKAKYIAICEGDDFWCVKEKLRSQYDIMESHPDYALLYGKACKYFADAGNFNGVIGRCVSGFDELLIKGNCIPTLTTFYRSKYSNEYRELDKPDGWKMGDYPLWLFLSTRGKIYFETKEYGVYRVLQSSASHFQLYNHHKNFEDSVLDIQLFFAKKEHLGKDVEYIIKQEHLKRLFRIAYDHREVDDAKKWYKLVKDKDVKMIIRRIIIGLYTFKIII